MGEKGTRARTGKKKRIFGIEREIAERKPS